MCCELLMKVPHLRHHRVWKKRSFMTVKHFLFRKQRVDYLTHMGKELHGIDPKNHHGVVQKQLFKIVGNWVFWKEHRFATKKTVLLLFFFSFFFRLHEVFGVNEKCLQQQVDQSLTLNWQSTLIVVFVANWLLEDHSSSIPHFAYFREKQTSFWKTTEASKVCF